MSRINLEDAPKTAGINYEQQVKSAMQQVMDKVEKTSKPSEIVRASLDVKKIFKTALSEGPQDKGFQRRISDLFCSVRGDLGCALTQANFDRR
jgi:hypothetical protein